jgi:hypothetical protein
MLGWIAIFLGLRSLSIALIKTKSYVDYALSLFFSCLALLLPFTYDPVPVLVIALVMGLMTFICSFKLLPICSLFSFIRVAFFSIFILLSFATITLQGLTQILEKKPIGTVIVTSHHAKKWVEWQSPDTRSQQGWQDSWEVIVQNQLGERIGSYFIYGDYVAIRARVIRFHPWLNFLGLPNVAIFESIFNGYKTMEKHNKSPHIGFPLRMPSSLLNWIWQESFFLSYNWPLIEATTLESISIPLSSPFSYNLIVGPTGFSLE